MNVFREIVVRRIATAIRLAPALLLSCAGAFGPAWGEDDFPDPVPTVKTYEWIASVAKEPNPALKYQFLLPLSERIAGNAAVFYKRAIITFLDGNRNEEQVQAWSDLPLEKLPVEEVRTFLAQRLDIFDSIKSASLCDTCDWGIRFQDLRGKNVIEVRLSEFQQSRALARLLRLKARLEIAEKRFDAAIATLGQSYQLSKDLGAAPTIIGNLVGVAVSAVTNETVGELLMTEGAPNLYWALRAIPDPIVDIRAAAQLESTMALRVFPFLNDAETAKHSADEWKQLLADAVQLMSGWGNRVQSANLNGQTQLAVMMTKSYPIAKRELISAGYDPLKIEQMHVGQVIAIYARVCYDHLSSENFKWMLVPFADGYERQKKASQELMDQGYLGSNANALPIHDPLLINTELTYAATQFFQAANRQRVMVTALMTVEAIRMHAAANSGKLPASLDQITVVPVPASSSTGKRPFYRVVDQRADLLIPPTDIGQEHSGRRILLRLR